MRRNFPTIASCVIIAAFLAFCLWQSTDDAFLSVSVAVLGTVLGIALFRQSERDWENGMGDIMETGYHLEDPRHPNNLRYEHDRYQCQVGCADELLVSNDHPDNKDHVVMRYSFAPPRCGIQITPMGNVMLHRDPDCYISMFSLN